MMSGEQTLAECGAAILRCYRHPESWVEGATTSNPSLLNNKLLKVEEIRLGGMAFVSEPEALANAAAIRAFAQSHGIAHLLRLVQSRDKVPYAVVPNRDFGQVLAVLQTL